MSSARRGRPPTLAGEVETAYRLARDVGLSTPGLRGFIRRRRALAVNEAYREIVAQYATMPVSIHSNETLLTGRSGANLLRFRSLTRPPRILFVGTDQLQDKSGILQGLGALADVTAFVQSDGTYGQGSRGQQLSFDLAVPNGRRLLELASEAEAAGRPLDMVIGQMWDGYIDGSALTELRRRHSVMVVNIGMDDRHAFTVRKLGRTIGTRGLIPHIDMAATASPESVDWYHKEGCPAVFFPEASDPTIFRPMPEVAKRFDVAFVGARYGIRQRIVERLQSASITVEARGSGWPAGRIATEDVPRLFAEARMILGVGTVGHSESLFALKLRDFDGPMSGTCYVTHNNADLERLFDLDREIVAYRDDDDCVRIIGELLVDDERREEIARRGRIRASRDHTWVGRFAGLLQVLRGQSPDGLGLEITGSG